MKTNEQINFLNNIIDKSFSEITERYSPLVYLSEIDCIFLKNGRLYSICKKNGDFIIWNDNTEHEKILSEYPDLIENKGDDILLKDGQKSKCCTDGNKHITYFKSSTGWLENGWMFDINNLCININYCPFCGNKLYNK